MQSMSLCPAARMMSANSKVAGSFAGVYAGAFGGFDTGRNGSESRGLASGITSNPANEGHLKSGQRRCGRIECFHGVLNNHPDPIQVDAHRQWHSGPKALNPRGLGTESPNQGTVLFRALPGGCPWLPRTIIWV